MYAGRVHTHTHHFTFHNQWICFITFAIVDQILVSTCSYCVQDLSATPLRRKKIWSHTPEPVERENTIPLWANRWRWLISPLALSAPSFQKRYQRQRRWERMPKGGGKRTKVWWCAKADKVRGSVRTFSYLMADLCKCIGSLFGSVATQRARNRTKILLSIRSVLIRLAQPSSRRCIWISGRTGAGVAHGPGPLRVPSAACQYARDTLDQCLLNHFPNRGNDNYKKWRLCTLCKCCAMTLEPNGPSY